MKKIACCICCLLLLAQCAKQENEDIDRSGQTNFPEHIENFGKAFAKEFRQTIRNLNDMGVNYSNADNTPEFKEHFYKNWYNASPALTKGQVSMDQIGLSPEKFAEGYRSLTPIQIEFIERIITESQKASSYDELFNVLIRINKDIYAQVPKIEQERLLYTTAILYYGLGEIQRLEKQGQMIVTPVNNVYSPLLKTKSESGGSIGGSCSRFLATIWTIALGEPTPFGEVVAAIATVVVGGVLLYEVVTCKSESGTGSNSENWKYCQLKFEHCSPIWGYQDPCSRCLEHCLAQGVWPGETMGCR